MVEQQGFTHFDQQGNAVMVAVIEKDITKRIAIAEGFIHVSVDVMDAILHHSAAKGDVLGVARIAGIMAVKKTSELIPLCHPLQISKCTIDFYPNRDTGTVHAVCTVSVTEKTGVEMEALTGISVTLLTIYDMCKAIDKSMTITNIRLLEKIGGKSGHYRSEDHSCE